MTREWQQIKTEFNMHLTNRQFTVFIFSAKPHFIKTFRWCRWQKNKKSNTLCTLSLLKQQLVLLTIATSASALNYFRTQRPKCSTLRLTGKVHQRFFVFLFLSCLGIEGCRPKSTTWVLRIAFNCFKLYFPDNLFTRAGCFLFSVCFVVVDCVIYGRGNSGGEWLPAPPGRSVCRVATRFKALISEFPTQERKKASGNMVASR